MRVFIYISRDDKMERGNGRGWALCCTYSASRFVKPYK